MTKDEFELFTKLKAEILKLMEGRPIDPERGHKAVVAACMLSEGMGMTFEVFSDPSEALQTIFACVERIGKEHGIDFRYVSGFEGEQVH